jgi:putative transposase
MRRIDELHLKHPFYGSRNIAHTLSAEGVAVNRKCVQRLMRVMDLESLAPKPNTIRPAPENRKYPYLLRNLKISLPNQVWATDISVPQISGLKDEGRSLAIGLQEQIANHRKRLGSKALVVSVAEKVP